MRTLILSISAGGGHVNASEAMECYIKLENPNNEVKVVDTIKYINPLLDKVVIGSYLKSLKLSPSLFGKLYDFAETGESIATFSNKLIEMIIHKLIPLIDDFSPDIIIATHAFTTEMVSILKAKGMINIPALSILTDYAPHSFWIHPNIDAYVVSTSAMVDEMIKRGVDKSILYPLGIPVKPNFLKKYPRENTLKTLNLNPDKKTVLLMGGSLGLGKLCLLYEELQKVDLDIQIIAITGNNKKLFNQLTELSSNSVKDTRIIGYTTEVNKYMQACDLLITKPGGLTITEALVSGVPLAVFSAIPGQEQKNAEFLLDNNLAVSLGEGKNCHRTINSLLCNSEKLENMRNNCLIFAKPNSGYDIKNLMHKLLKANISKSD
ncbi:MAG: UDP-N-acetylglucosamine--LPS N-acetylglucosamine transferase [Clostridiales bacterium]|uniref:MGDG synthase family glycosyltransferase n=1 Tax=Clostridium sp. N3C TaxID=1776758 RepID=UPI00092E1B52|nr:glycosyltransferase [Clostridium sp. N3C]NLZ47716.1 UDP-N-acetylglucosamine--LPS N-acetylglucosamine transferase [Clostridiales bacterium]SCN23859.1 Processive diacylglycerol glucosyltransferase [Clostridium sp. N3C]